MTNVGEWSIKIPEPEAGGYWWFYGFLDDHDPQLIAFALHDGEFYGFGESKPVPRQVLIGCWMPIVPPMGEGLAPINFPKDFPIE